MTAKNVFDGLLSWHGSVLAHHLIRAFGDRMEKHDLQRLSSTAHGGNDDCSFIHLWQIRCTEDADSEVKYASTFGNHSNQHQLPVKG